MLERNIYYWDEIGEIPVNASGIYAWYFTPTLFDIDIDELLASISSGDDMENRKKMESFLSSSIFQYFAETPYTANISGPLKVRYEGSLTHDSRISSSLVNRLIENPDRLRIIKDVLSVSIPEFASPLYIGMSKSLGTRLKKHKSLIAKYRDQESTINGRKYSDNTSDDRDNSFALEVAERKLPPAALSVFTTTVPTSDELPDIYKDIENILNRIHFPLFGKN